MMDQNILFSEQKIPFVGKFTEILPLLFETIKYAAGAHLVSPFERIIIGVAGGAGAGKSKLASEMVQHLAEFEPTIITMDRFYKDNVNNELIDLEIPDAVDFNLVKETLSRIKDHDEQVVELPVFNVSTLKRSGLETIKCGKLVIFEGPFSVYPEFQAFLNMGVFIDALESIRFQRRIAKEVQAKGKSYSAVQAHWNNTVSPAYFKYIAVQRKFADVVVINNEASHPL